MSGQELGHWKEDRASHWEMSDLVKSTLTVIFNFDSFLLSGEMRSIEFNDVKFLISPRFHDSVNSMLLLITH